MRYATLRSTVTGWSPGHLIHCYWLAGWLAYRLPATGYRGLACWLAGLLMMLPYVAPMERTWTRGRLSRNVRARGGLGDLVWLGWVCWVGVVWLVVMGDGGSDGGWLWW